MGIRDEMVFFLFVSSLVTRHAAGVLRPIDRLVFSTVASSSVVSLVPLFVLHALADPYWCHGM
jgi:hypothetical protein